MASMVPPQYGVAYIFYVALVDQSNTKVFKASSTQASGDWKISKDGGALANLTNLPAVTPSGSVMVQISLTATEMQADNVTVVGRDASGAEWADLVINIQTSARRIDDLTYPATSGRSTAIDASGQVTVGAIAANAITATAINADAITAAKIADGAIDAATFAAGAINAAAIATDAITAAKIAADAIGASELAADAVTEIQSGLATSASIVTLQADTDDIQTRLPAALVSGRIDASVGAMAANVLTATAIATDAITAAKIAADAIGASELAADAVTEIQSGLSTLTAATVRSAVGLASANLDTQLDALPTNAELTTALGTADDATLAAIAALTIPTVADILAGVIEGSITLKGALRLALAALTGKASGGGTTTVIFRDTGDTKARITATVDSNGNRTSVSRDISD